MAKDNPAYTDDELSQNRLIVSVLMSVKKMEPRDLRKAADIDRTDLLYIFELRDYSQKMFNRVLEALGYGGKNGRVYALQDANLAKQLGQEPQPEPVKKHYERKEVDEHKGVIALRKHLGFETYRDVMKAQPELKKETIGHIESGKASVSIKKIMLYFAALGYTGKEVRERVLADKNALLDMPRGKREDFVPYWTDKAMDVRILATLKEPSFESLQLTREQALAIAEKRNPPAFTLASKVGNMRIAREEAAGRWDKGKDKSS